MNSGSRGVSWNIGEDTWTSLASRHRSPRQNSRARVEGVLGVDKTFCVVCRVKSVNRGICEAEDEAE